MKLYVLTTPIGNIEDATKRLIHFLKDGELFFVEDTRKFFNLLERLGISAKSKRVVVYNDHKQDKTDEYIEMIKSYEYGCIVSDAGSPILSDPAFPMVRSVVAVGGEVVSVPGATSVMTALDVSGLAPTPFKFHGFLPRKGEELKKFLQTLEPGCSHCFFESPHRASKTLELMSAIIPECDIFVGRELTKVYEAHHRFKAKDFMHIKDDINFKGEFVIILRFAESSVSSLEGGMKLYELAQDYMKKPSSKKLAKLLAAALNEKVSDIYEQLSGNK